MNELNQQIKDPVQIVGQKHVKEKSKLLGSFIIPKGLKVWQVDRVTKEVKEAELIIAANIKGGVTKKRLRKKACCIVWRSTKLTP